MIPLLLGAAGAAWLVGTLVGGREALRKQFPFVPASFWRPRDRLFTVKESAYFQLKQIPRLNALYRDYAAAHPDDAFSLLLLAIVAGNEGRWEDSLGHAVRLEEAAPQYSVGAWRRASACLQLGRNEEASAALRRFLELEPDSVWVPHVQTTLARLEAQQARAAPKRASEERVAPPAKTAKRRAVAKARPVAASRPRRKT